jgi:hypothetical protein
MGNATALSRNDFKSACVQRENSTPLSEILWEPIISQPTGIVAVFFLILAFTDEMGNRQIYCYGLRYVTQPTVSGRCPSHKSLFSTTAHPTFAVKTTEETQEHEK